jgi:gamma-tubulin complex component 2
MHGFVCFQTLQFLQQNAKERAELAASAATSNTTSFSIPVAASKMSTQELEELRKQLGSVSTGSTLQQVPDLPWSTVCELSRYVYS